MRGFDVGGFEANGLRDIDGFDTGGLDVGLSDVLETSGLSDL